MPVIGVLALQGAFIEHIHKLERIGVDAREIRLPDQIAHVDALIIPGGESTTIGKLIDRFELREPICELASTGKPVWGTCAGMILLAREVDEETRARSQPLLGLMDLTVTRNAFGTQLDSFETDLSIPVIGRGSHPCGLYPCAGHLVGRPERRGAVLARRRSVVAVRQDNLIATSFHPELTPDDRLHSWFADLAQSHAAKETHAHYRSRRLANVIGTCRTYHE